MSRKAYVTIISIAVALVLACLCVIGVVMFGSNTKSNFNKHITAARQYYDKLDYKSAVFEYEEALKLNDKDVDAYIGISKAYVGMGNISKAVAYLRKGYELTGSDVLYQMLKQYENDMGNYYSIEEVAAGSMQVSLYKDLFSMLRTYTYEQYGMAYKLLDSSTDTVKEYDGLPARFIYASAPAPKDRPSSIEVTSIALMFNGFTSGVSYERLSQLDIYNLNYLPASSNNGRNAVEFDVSGCHVIVETDEGGNIVSSAPWNSITINSGFDDRAEDNVANTEPNVDFDDNTVEEGHFILKGTAYNEAKGNSGGKVEVKIYQGDKPDKSMLVEELSTTSKGKYRVELVPGKYYVEALLDKEVVFNETIEVTDADEIKILDLPYSFVEELRRGEIRVILSWPDKNANLDHVLEGIDGNGDYAYCSHSPMDPGYHEHYSRTTGELVISSGAEVTGGPEEITVYDIDGSYDYHVEAWYGDTIAGAVVEVYTYDSSTPIVYKCPEDYESDYWIVFRYEDGKVKDVS